MEGRADVKDAHGYARLQGALTDLKCAEEPALDAIRREVREFCATQMPEALRRKVVANEPLTKDDHLDWHRRLKDAGLLTAHWPREYGGRGWTRVQRWTFETEVYRAGSPWLVPFGITYVAPVLYTFGTKAQIDRWLPRIANCEHWWAQGYSEPDAGSDLAAVATRARREGDRYVVNGQKTWTTMAQWANMIFILARTSDDAKPQRGISFLLVDINSPGVSVRPIETIDEEHHVNEVFFDNVEVPLDNLIGEEGSGWRYAKFLLDNERLLGAEVGRAQRLISDLETLLRSDGPKTGRLIDDPEWRRRLASLNSEALVLESLAHDLLAQADAGRDPGALASMLKLIGSELLRKITTAQVDVIDTWGLPVELGTGARVNGDGSAPAAAGILRRYLHDLAVTVYGGSSEIQRNIIAKAALHL